MKTYKVTTNNAKSLNDFVYQIIRLEDDLICYSNGIYANAKKFAKMLEIENEFAGIECKFIYEV